MSFEDLEILYDRLLVEPIQEESKIIIPDAYLPQARKGRIVKTGPGKKKTCKTCSDQCTIPMQVHVGQIVYFGPNVGQPQRVMGKEYIAMNEKDVIAVLEG